MKFLTGWRNQKTFAPLGYVIASTLLFLFPALGYIFAAPRTAIDLVIEIGGSSAEGKFNPIMGADAVATRIRDIHIPILLNKSEFSRLKMKVYRVFPVPGNNADIVKVGCDNSDLDLCLQFVSQLSETIEREHLGSLEQLREGWKLQDATLKRISEIRSQAIAASKNWIDPVESAVVGAPKNQSEPENPWRELKGLAFLTDAVQKFPELLVENEMKLGALKLQLNSIRPTQKTLVTHVEENYALIGIAAVLLLGTSCGLLLSFAMSRTSNRSPSSI
jgi:hypothetical protein